MNTYYVYMLTNYAKTVLYTGVTNSLKRRLLEHINGEIPGFTQRYHVDRLVYFERTNDIRYAIHREKEIKGWTRAKKNALVETVNPEWKDFSEDVITSSAFS